jgi:hypothetical protein
MKEMLHRCLLRQIEKPPRCAIGECVAALITVCTPRSAVGSPSPVARSPIAHSTSARARRDRAKMRT